MIGENEAAAALAHEVINPLSLIRANLDVVSGAVRGSKEEKCIELIYREVERINSVLSGFAAKREDSCVIYIEDLLCDVIEEYHIVAGKNVQFVIEVSGENICVAASYSKLCILFFNILKNAVEAVGSNGSICTCIYKESEFAVVSIEDNGTGIDESIAAVIGRPFVTSKADGMGLGLLICKKITEEYEGSITMQNGDRGGCVVTIKLPLYME